ncbi:uncharacterized protein LOC128870279 [Anastrepha ludens]|uniref:uncharacterized protein LOC128870279 n=1 Tax=Anastrepha ludens TaxID=28586 RepID=UPI0023B0CD00|nr:uncharacterized protein LOC128870279 [Anastrepha ludens]
MSLDPIELECRLDILNCEHSEKLMKCQSKIEEIDEEDIARGELEDLIVETKPILARNKSSIAETSFIAPHCSRLPKMSLPKFKGEYSEFKSFMSLFESFVHNDLTTPDIEKFNHLVSCLSGEALGTVKSFQMSEENYPKALESGSSRTDLTADKLIFALKRFIGRRGMPAKIYCDNATNFVGAERKLRELREGFLRQKEEILQYAADEGFIFAFIPPRAPHFGGLWEAAVKSAKHLLVRAVGNALLTAEETATLLVEVEAVLNSRPVAPLSNDPNDGKR